MAQTTVDHSSFRTDDESDLERREWLRSLLPTVASVAVLLGLAFVAGLLLEDLAQFGAWFIAQS